MTKILSKIKNLFKFFYYYFVFKSFFKLEKEKIKEEVLKKQKIINIIKQNLKYDLYQSELEDLEKNKKKYEENIRNLEAKNKVLIQEINEMQNKNLKQSFINERLFFKLHDIEEREAKIIKIEAAQKILNSNLVDKINNEGAKND